MISVNSYRKLQSDSTRAIPTKTRRPKNRNGIPTTSSRLPSVPEQPKTKSKTKKALTMKVKELRSWLSELGDKNQEHYHRFQNRSSKVPPSSTKPIAEGDDLLGIQSKPSMASSCPSTAILEDNNDPLFATSFSSEEDTSSSSSPEGARSDLYQRNGESVTKNLFHEDRGGVERISTKNHLKLILQQAPRNQEGCPYSVNCADDGSYDGSFDDDREDTENSSFQGMCEPPLFRDQILTKATLDAMSGSATKTLGEQLQELKENQFEQQRQDSGSEKNALYHGDDEEDSKTDNSSTDAPSIGPAVLVSKLANAFLNNHSATLDQAPPPLRRKFVDPRDLTFLHGSPPAITKPREDLAYANPPRTPTTTVGKGIRKFGGPRKGIVERRTEQLHKKFGDTRSAIFVQKKTWGQKTAHGKYQRTTTVEKVYK